MEYQNQLNFPSSSESTKAFADLTRCYTQANRPKPLNSVRLILTGTKPSVEAIIAQAVRNTEAS